MLEIGRLPKHNGPWFVLRNDLYQGTFSILGIGRHHLNYSRAIDYVKVYNNESQKVFKD